MHSENRLKDEVIPNSKFLARENSRSSVRMGSMRLETIVKDPIFFGDKYGESALPPSKPTFRQMLPTILYCVLVQWQVLYFIAVGMFKITQLSFLCSGTVEWRSVLSLFR